MPGFESGGEVNLITYRPEDQGLPQVAADAPPPDVSGQVEEPPDYGGTFAEAKGITDRIDGHRRRCSRDLHSRLIVHGTTLELSFHLAVKARIRLLAERHKKLVASTPMRTLAAGNRKLLLRAQPQAVADEAVAADPRARPAAEHDRQRSGGRAGTRGRGLEHGFDRPDRSSAGAHFRGTGKTALSSTGKRPGTVSVRPSLVGALALAGLLALIGALALAGALPGPGATSRAAAQPAAVEPTPQTDASVPASDVTMIGATPNEAGAPGPDETWGVGGEKSGAGTEAKTIAVLVRYAGGSGWTLVQRLDEGPLAGFQFESSPLAGQMTPHGDGVLAGTLPKEGGGSQQAMLVRKQGGAFEATPAVTVESETPQPGEEPLLHKGEALFGSASSRAPLIAPLEEEGGEAGALVVPIREGSGVENQVLHFDGHRWTSEPIEIPNASKEDFRVLGIAATSPTNAWLLAQLSSKAPIRPAPSRSSGACAKAKANTPNGSGSRSRRRAARGKKPNR